jgi:prephenate dehydrogenase
VTLGRVVVMGCGLIGGSIVKRLRERGGAASLAAVDRAEVLAAAAPLLDEGAEPDTEAVTRLLARADLVVLAMPLDAIAAALPQVLDRISPNAVVTDCGSVKRPVIARAVGHARRDRFVPAHPMAGRETGGFEMALPALFEGRRWYVVPEAGAVDARARVVELIGALGAIAVEVDAEHHDRAMAYVSHAPHLIASALVDVAEVAGASANAGPGFEDMTRIAGGPPSIWCDILAANHANVAQALDDVITQLVGMRDELAAHADERGLQKSLSLLTRVRRIRGK